MTDVYRACASIMVFRSVRVRDEEGTRNVQQILLLHKLRKRDDWQLPQGGVEEGETVKQAAQRELKEEADLEVTVLGQSDVVYEYDFPESFRRFRPDNVCGQRISFVFAQYNEGQKVCVDGEEIDGHVWINPEQIPLYIHRPEYVFILKQLVEEGQTLLS